MSNSASTGLLAASSCPVKCEGKTEAETETELDAAKRWWKAQGREIPKGFRAWSQVSVLLQGASKWATGESPF